MKLHVSPAKLATLGTLAAAALAPVLVAAALPGSGGNASTSADAVARAGAARTEVARTTAARLPNPAGLSESALRAQLMGLRALGRLRGPVLSQLLDRLAAQGAAGAAPTTGPISTGPISTGMITGVVRGANGSALRGVCVTATARAGQAGTAGRAGWARTAFTTTGPTGRYVLTGLRPGSYTLAYRDCAAPGRYFGQWSGGAAWPELATPVSVTAGQVRSAAPVTLRPTNPAALATPQPWLPWITDIGQATSTGQAASTGGGGISGLVTGKGKPLKGICVLAFRLDNRGGVVRATTSRTGSYSIGGLRRGRYGVLFAAFGRSCPVSNWLPQFYKGVNPFSSRRPTPIVLKAGQKVRGIDANLKLGGQISGIVTDKSGKGLREICVEIIQTFRNGAFAEILRTGQAGRYAVHAVTPGRYTVGFAIGCGNKGNYAPQWWRDSPTIEHATKILIVGPKIAGNIDATLQPGAVITGVVRAVNAAGQPLSGVCVSAVNRDGSIFANASTAPDGRYRLIGLGTGRYQVGFDPSCGGNTTTIYLSASQMVTARVGTTKTANEFLPIGAGLSGTVTDSHGHPVSGICVQIASQQGSGGATQTASDGTYTIEGVPAGSYLEQFSGGCGNSGSYAPQFYRAESNLFDADSIALTTGTITPSINATMQPGGTITGVITNRAGHRVGGTCAVAFGQTISAAGGGFYVGFTGNGNYSVPNMAPGQYQVQFGCNGKYASQNFSPTPGSHGADLVSVNPGAATRGIDGALSLAGRISGVVTDQAGHPLRGICVFPLRLPLTSGAILVQGMITNSHGAYQAGDLAPGTYVVQFFNCEGHLRYGSQWYHGKTTLAAATRVRVPAGGAARGIGAAMTLGGSITGQVRLAGKNTPLINMCVLAFDQAEQSSGFAATDLTGHYTIPALDTGNYQLEFGPCRNENLVPIIRPGLVHVTAPHVTTHINAALSVGGSVSGTVLGGSPTAKPREGICVDVIPSNPNGFGAGTVTGPDGTYSATGLAPGGYRVLFGDPTCGIADTTFGPSWYNDKPSQSTADTITVTAGATTSGIGATLLTGGLGAISGTVTGPSSAPVGGECVTALNITATLSPLLSGGPPEVVATHADGSYTLGFLLPGTYKVRFDTGCGAPKFRTQWWDNAATQSAATTVTVSANATTSGVNAALQH